MPTTRIQSAATSGTTKTAKMSAAGTRDDDRAADARANAIMYSTAGIHTASDRDDREGQAADGRGPEQNWASDRHADQRHDARRGQNDGKGECRQEPFRSALSELTVRRAQDPQPHCEGQIGEGGDERQRRARCRTLSTRERSRDQRILHRPEALTRSADRLVPASSGSDVRARWCSGFRGSGLGR